MMKLKFYIDEFDVADVEVADKFRGVAYVLSDNSFPEYIQELLSVINNKSTWSSSFNKSYIEIDSDKVRCGELYNETSFVDLKPNEFRKLLKSWMGFIEDKDVNKEQFLSVDL